MTQDPYRYFRVEARELLGRLEQGVLGLEKSAPTAQLVQELLRHAHTLKGAARVVKQPAIAEEAHAVEGSLASLRAGGVAAGRHDIDDILLRLDHITQLVTQLAVHVDGERSEGQDRPDPDLPPEFTVDSGDVAALIDGISEALVQIGSLRRDMDASVGRRSIIDLPTAPPSDSQQGFGSRPVDASARGRARTLGDDPQASPGSRTRHLPISLDHLERELAQARDAAIGLRLVMAKALFGPLERIARDTARAQGKRVVFEARGGDLRLEAAVLRNVQDALVQAVRNAVAHGIENENDRRAAGKPPQGLVRLDVIRRGDRAAFVCRDDGQGLDLASVRSVAQARGLLGTSSAEIDTKELIGILLRGGLSTSKMVTEVAGRGIGLDVIREATARVGGEVALSTEESRGTTVEVIVPLSISAFDALIVRTGGMEVAIPLDGVQRTARVTPDQFAHGTAGISIVQEGDVLPFAYLSQCLQIGPDSDPAGEAWTAVILSDGERLAAVGVERLVGTSRVIFRKLPMMAPADPVVAGVFLDVEGNPQLVLDPRSLVVAASCPSRASARTRRPGRPPVLIVDDSLTTRMLEQSILESAGYEVDLAVSGEDALEKAGRRSYGLFLVDIEMPGMDGFEFVERIRSDPELRDTAAILVTSRDSPEDRRRGEQVGASAHISKGDFDQARLLERIQGLIG
jgi:two-component system chemotaxis sensor kinase CheA